MRNVHGESHSLQEDKEHSETTDVFPEFDGHLAGVNETLPKLRSTHTSLTIPPQRRHSSSEIVPRIHISKMSKTDVANRIWRFEKPTRFPTLKPVHHGFPGPTRTTTDGEYMQHKKHSIGPEDRNSEGGVSIKIDQHSSRSTSKNLLAVNPGAHQTYEPQNPRISTRKSVFAAITAPAIYCGIQRRLRRVMLTRSLTLTPITRAAPENRRLHHYGSRAKYLLDKDRSEDRIEQVVTRKGQVGSAAVLRLTHLESADNSNSLPPPVALRSHQQYGDSHQQRISTQLKIPLPVDHRASQRTQHGVRSFPVEGANSYRLRSEVRPMGPTVYRTVESLVPNEWAPVISVTRVPVSELSNAVYNTMSRQSAAASTPAWGIPDVFHRQMPNINPNVRIPGAAISVPPARPALPYQPNSQAMFPDGPYPSQKYQRLLPNGPPSYGTAIQEDYLPFFEAGRSAIPAQWGVIKITEVSTLHFMFLKSLNCLHSSRSLASFSQLSVPNLSSIR